MVILLDQIVTGGSQPGRRVGKYEIAKVSRLRPSRTFEGSDGIFRAPESDGVEFPFHITRGNGSKRHEVDKILRVRAGVGGGGVGGSPQAVVEEFIELRTSGQVVASPDLATAEVVEGRQDFSGGLEVWNLSGELTEPCEETSSGFRCVLSEQNDFHAAGGLGPWTVPLILTVNEAGLISATEISVVEWESTINPFNTRFMDWFGLAHPEVAAQMSGAPMSNTFNPEDARLALEYVDEFVAQSDDYPIDGTDS